MPHNLLKHITKDLKKCNQKVNLNNYNLRFNREINQILLTASNTSTTLLSELNDVFSSLVADKINNDQFTKEEDNTFTRFVPISKDDLLSVNGNYDLLSTPSYTINVNSDTYDSETLTFTTPQNIPYQVMDVGFRYKNYLIVTNPGNNVTSKMHLLKPNINVLSTVCEKKIYNEELIKVFLISHKINKFDSVVNCDFELWKRNGLLPSEQILLENIDLNLNNDGGLYLAYELSSGSYYIKITPTVENSCEILNNELHIENDDNEIVSSDTFIVKNSAGFDAALGGKKPKMKLVNTKSKGKKNKSKKNKSKKNKSKKNKSKKNKSKKNKSKKNKSKKNKGKKN